MTSKRVIGTLKKLDSTSKVDDNGRSIHTIGFKLEIIDGQGMENIEEITRQLNKPMRVDFDIVQLEMN